MGLVYTIILQDDFDWEYVGKNKQEILHNFELEFEKIEGFKPEKIAEWYGHTLYNVEKSPPEALRELIKKYCDSCYYWNDSEPNEKKKLNLLTHETNLTNN